MNKHDITEVGIKLIAFYVMLKSIIAIVTSAVLPMINLLLGGERMSARDITSTVIALITLSIGQLAVKKSDWILSRLYATK